MENRSETLKKLLTATQEDYLEAVLYLTTRKKVARNMEIADLLGVKRASVTRAVKLLSQKGLVEHETHGYVTLTELGRSIAVEITERHRLFTRFFRDILGVSQSESDDLACKIEHLISGGVLQKFRDFIERTDVHMNQDNNRKGK
jgi:DtxR family transcriptional regulator, Mn-dependent transcriptional regulator